MLDQPASQKPNAAAVPFDIDLATIRGLASAVPGALPVALNAVKVAASIRPRKLVIEGGDDTPVTMPRTAYQLVYPDGTVIIDAGMDKQTHDSFGEGEPYYPEAFAALQTALATAKLIVLTHYHADHVAGVINVPQVESLARKTIATRQTLDLMVNKPHRPHLKLAEDRAQLFIALDYDRYYPVAPGLVLIEAPGHSPDMQMVFIRLQSGQEFLHSIDAAWNMDNIRQVKGKAAPWVTEDVPAVLGQLQWLHDLGASEPRLKILVTHDGEWLDQAVREGCVGDTLQI